MLNKDQSNNSDDKEIELQPISHSKSSLEKLPKDVLMNVFGFLDIKSLLHALQTNRFMASYIKDNQFWERYIKNYLTKNPQLLEKETYYNYIKRHRKILVKVYAWFKKDFTDDEKVSWFGKDFTDDEMLFVILSELIERNLEKLFITLLRNEPDFEVNNYYTMYRGGRLLIHCAVYVNNTVILNELIEQGADLEIKQFGYVLENGYPSTKSNGENPLQLAAERGSYECMKILLDRKVDINAVCKKTGYTALHYAAEWGRLNCVQLLVENKATLNKKTYAGNTPYQLAKNVGNSDCAEYLAEKMQEKNINVPNSKCLVQ